MTDKRTLKLDGPNLQTFNLLVGDYEAHKDRMEAAMARLCGFIELANPDVEKFSFDMQKAEYIPEGMVPEKK